MTIFCPECEDEAQGKPVGYKDCMETYTCQVCKDGYCCHLMKTNGPEYVCWTCGSEKRVPNGQI